MSWVPDPRTCRNCHGLGLILHFEDEGWSEDCGDCKGTGTEHAVVPDTGKEE